MNDPPLRHCRTRVKIKFNGINVVSNHYFVSMLIVVIGGRMGRGIQDRLISGESSCRYMEINSGEYE